MSDGTFVRAAALADVPEGVPTPVLVNGKRLALFNLGDTVHATDEMCTHADYSLCEGHMEGCNVVCPLHFASFDVRTGAVVDPPACEDLTSYPVKIDGDDILVSVS